MGPVYIYLNNFFRINTQILYFASLCGAGWCDGSDSDGVCSNSRRLALLMLTCNKGILLLRENDTILEEACSTTDIWAETLNHKDLCVGSPPKDKSFTQRSLSLSMHENRLLFSASRLLLHYHPSFENTSISC